METPNKSLVQKDAIISVTGPDTKTVKGTVTWVEGDIFQILTTHGQLREYSRLACVIKESQQEGGYSP